MTDPILKAIESHPTLVAVVTFLIGLAISGIGARFGSVSVREKLEDPASWPALIEEYGRRNGAAYFHAIQRVLSFAARVYGPNPMGMAALGRCLQFALAYPALILLIGWVLFDAGRLGGSQFFSLGTPGLLRALFASLLLFGCVAAVIFISDRPEYSKFERDLHSKLRRLRFFPSNKNMLIRLLTVAFFLVILAAFAAGSGGLGSVACGIVLVTSFAFFLGPMPGIGFRVIAILVLFLLVGAIGTALGIGTELGLVVSEDLILFGALLPALNAFADFASLWFTRSFLSKVHKDKPAIAPILALLAFDLIAAAACLAVLTGSIVLVLEIWARLAPDTLVFDWHLYWQTLQQDPRQGTALYLMVATTLIPTFVHVIAGLGAILTYRPRLRAKVAAKLQEAQAEGRDLTKVEVGALTDRIRTASFFGLLTASIAAAIGFLILWHGVWKGGALLYSAVIG